MAELLLSSVLNMDGEFASIARTIESLRAQTVRESVEVIIIARREHVDSIDHLRMRVFGAYQIVEVDSLPSGAYGWAEGFRKARAPIVVISEDHGFPEPNWAQTLIDAHRTNDCIAVCPAIANGNPDTCTSWANYTLSFVEWFAHPDEPPREVTSGAGHNTSYKREPLLAEYGGKALDGWLNPERVLHGDLVARGKRIMLDPRTRVAHVNVSLPTAYFGVSYAGGRVFGSARSRHWGIGRKLFYAAMFPVVPFLRLRRIASSFNTPAKRGETKFLKTMPLIVAGLYCHAVGEAVGYLRGSGEIVKRYTNYELKRRDFVTPSERAAVFGM